MRSEYGWALAIALILAFIIWHRTKGQASKVVVAPNVETNNAGNEVPTVPVSNAPATANTSDWYPFYLTGNYPVERGGNNVIPSTVVGQPNWQFGPQEMVPSF